MKNLLHYFVSVIMILSLTFMTGCEKDEDGGGTDKASLLTSHIWNFDKLSTTSTDSDVQLLVNLMAVFMTDATISFSSNGTYTMTMLDESDSGTWELSADGTKLTMDETDQVTVTTLTSDVFEFKESASDADFGTFDVMYRWVK